MWRSSTTACGYIQEIWLTSATQPRSFAGALFLLNRAIDPDISSLVVDEDVVGVRNRLWPSRSRAGAHMVLIHADGIEWRGQRYHSLSVVAREITGARWSGPRFFGLRQRQLDSTSSARAGHGAG